MQQDGRNPPEEHRNDSGGTASRTSFGGGGKDLPPPLVRLRREFKGLTVRDLLADAGLDDRLPGAVRSALQHIERGDLAAAERSLPGHFAPVLAGPGPARARRRLARWIVFAALAAAMATATIKLL